MEHTKLSIKDQELDLVIAKTKSGYEGHLIFDSVLLHKADESAFSMDIRVHEGETLIVKVSGCSVFYEGKEIATFDNMLEDVSAKLGQRQNHTEEALVAIQGKTGKKLIVGEVKISQLPKELFARRNWFPVRIYDDNNWMIVRYANLHQHTEASLLDGIVRVPELVKKTEWAAAITDHGNMFAFNDFYKRMKKADKLPIIGCEVYVETVGGKARPVLLLPKQDEDALAEEQMFNNEKVPVSTLAGEHLILLAETDEGLHNLFHLVTESSKNFYRKPHVTWELLEKYHNGLIATSACIAGTLGKSIAEILKCEKYSDLDASTVVKQANEEIADLFCSEMIRLFGRDNFFIELQNHHFPLETAIMERVKEYAREYDLKTTVGIDAHYLNAEDAEVHEMWLCQQTKKKMSDPDRMRFSGDGYFVHTSDEVVSLFPNDIEALDNTLDIAWRCQNVELVSDGYHLPTYPLPKGFESDKAYLSHLVDEGFKRLWKDGELGTTHTDEEKKKYVERYNYELGVINQMGWASYFLVVSDFIAYAQDTKVASHLERYFPSSVYDHKSLPEAVAKKDYEVYIGTGRGSAAGSLVCCCLGITKVDPIKYDLLFERFLSPDRVSMPDIDTDLEDSGREIVIEYCRVKYNSDYVSRIAAFGTAKAKAALKTIARVNGESVALGNELANAVPAEPGMTIEKAEEMNPDFKVMESDKKKASLIESAKRIEGLWSNRTIHACGVLIADKPVVEYMPQLLDKNPRGDGQVWVTELQAPECEEMGLLKMDFLGLITLGIAHEAIDLIKRNHGVDIRYDEIPLNDVTVYRFLVDGNTAAVFQAESEIFTKTLTGVLKDVNARIKAIKADDTTTRDEKIAESYKLGEELFMRVSDCNALVRPGPNQYIEEYTENILDPSKVTYDDPSMEEYLKSTGGIMLYQEQVMLLVRKMAGFTPGQADTIRKAMGKKHKEILDEFAEYFVTGSVEKGIKGCLANGIPENVARKVWSDMEKFAGYAFNKSHAVAYSMHTVRTAWLARNYYPEYMTAVLNANIKKADKIRGYISVCKQHGLEVLPPSINESVSDFSTNGETIRFGLGGLKNVGSVSDAIIQEREANGPYTSYQNFLYRLSKYKLTSRALESLIYAGCLDEFDSSSRKAKIEGLSIASSLVSDLRKVSQGYTLLDIYKEQSNNDASNLLKFEYDKDVEEMDKSERLQHEDEVVGFYMSGHPMDAYTEILQKTNVRKIFDVIKDFNTDDEEEIDTDNSKVLKNVTFAGIIKECERKLTKKGDPWWTVTVEDETGIIKGTYFNHDTSNRLDVEECLKKYSLIQIQGTVKDDGYGTEISIECAAPLSKYMNITQAKAVTIYIHSDSDEYTFNHYGKVFTVNTAKYIKEVISRPVVSYGSKAEIKVVTLDEHLLKKEVKSLGDHALSLEQYVLLQRCVGASNVVASFE